MIVRILGEGQFYLEASALDRVNEIDALLEKAVEQGDEDRFREALTTLIDDVREAGHPHDADALEESDVILPPADATLEEVRDLLGDDGLLPG